MELDEFWKKTFDFFEEHAEAKERFYDAVQMAALQNNPTNLTTILREFEEELIKYAKQK